MSRARTLLCVVYALIAATALYATWSQNLAYFGDGVIGAFAQFAQEARVNPASRSITIDIGFFLLAAAILMLGEARRLKMRFAWVYLVIGFLVAISVSFPLFMIARERAMAKAGQPPAPLNAFDLGVLAATGALVLGLTGYVLAG